jgi:N-acetylneuraminic acid mutarotase
MNEYDFKKKKWKIVQTCKVSTFNHSSTIWNDKIYIFGGFGSKDNNVEKELNIMLEFDLNNFNFKEIDTKNTPLERWGHSSVLYNGLLYIFGGTNHYYHSHPSSIHVLDIKNKYWYEIEKNNDKAPSPRWVLL